MGGRYDRINARVASEYREILVPSEGGHELQNIPYHEIGHMLAEDYNRRDRKGNVIPFRSQAVAQAVGRYRKLVKP